jgi:hypothetical protein
MHSSRKTVAYSGFMSECKPEFPGFLTTSCLPVPLRMRRPASAREALGFSPLMEARRANASFRRRIQKSGAGSGREGWERRTCGNLREFSY